LDRHKAAPQELKRLDFKLKARKANRIAHAWQARAHGSPMRPFLPAPSGHGGRPLQQSVRWLTILIAVHCRGSQ